MARRSFTKRLRDRARELGSRAVDDLLSDEQRAGRVGAAVRKLQGSRRAFDERASRVIAAFGFATQEDLERVSRKIGRVRKRLTRLRDRLETGART